MERERIAAVKLERRREEEKLEKEKELRSVLKEQMNALQEREAEVYMCYR